MRVILGVDPGSRITGYGVIEQNGQKSRYLASGAIHTVVQNFPERLKIIFDGIDEIILRFKPEIIAFEEVFVARNVSSALKLGHARGAAMVAAARHNLPIAEYSTRKVKQVVTGRGAADKIQVQHMVRVLLNLPDTPQADAADALAVAIAHSHMVPEQRYPSHV